MNLAGMEAALAQVWRWTWETSLSASALLVLVGAVQFLFGKRLPAQGRYALSGLIVFRLLLPTLLISHGGFAGISSRFSASTERQAEMTVAITPAAAYNQPEALNPLAIHAAVPVKPAPEPGLGLLELLWTLGLLLSLAGVGWQQWRFSKWIREQPVMADPRLQALLDRAKATMGVRQEVRLVLVKEGHVPALYAWRRPRLLLPESCLARAEERELELIFLHELAHLKRHDILLNWVLILVQSWHWFNPMVWLALRRLRADREIVRDAMVVRHLGSAERRLYGKTLVKLLESFSESKTCPSLVPMVSHKHEIKRRIIMIAHYKTARRTAWVLTISVMAALCWLTFTRAADQDKKKAAADASAAKPALSPDTPSPPRPARGVEVLQRKMQEQREKVLSAQQKLDTLRQQLGGLEDFSSISDYQSNDPETVRMLERERISIETQKVKYEALRAELKRKTKEELLQTLPTACPDNLLNSMLERLSNAETELARLSSDLGPQSQQIKAVASVIENLHKQIDARVEGILAGISAQVAASEATSARLNTYIADLNARDADARKKYQPYFVAKRDLDTQQRLYETLQLRLLQETVDTDLANPPALAPVK